MFRIEWSNRAQRQLDKLARRNPEIAKDIFEKVELRYTCGLQRAEG